MQACWHTQSVGGPWECWEEGNLRVLWPFWSTSVFMGKLPSHFTPQVTEDKSLVESSVDCV